ncbi:Bifunctional nuclease [Actinidia chinensis var. chinensis]|uniref:Bifunctional nuclease n=1 Tax=Actinidia chinensis var. chinensis TaxID=1590841 RepID=A0A2R6Q220_ACTCC|nr:Bifunctional nuclease [Actinidia chinensis var. chinensis]
MVGAQFCVRTVPGFGGLTDQSNVSRQIWSSLTSSSSPPPLRLSFQSGFWHRHCRKSQLILVSCKSSRRFGDKSNDAVEPDHEYLEAFVLISETIRHHRLRQGFQDEIKWQATAQLLPFSAQAKEYIADVSSIGKAFLRRFQSPTIFLKISCDGDFLLPIIVGEFAVEKLIDSYSEDESWECRNQFQFVRNLVEKLGYGVTMVRITERVVNTYFARIYFCKPGEKEILSVDARPSDAINVAKRCRAPIYVNKQILLTDGIKFAYGMGRMRDTKSIYDVSLDGAADGPDSLAEELDLVRNMNLAIHEERYGDAAMWRDKLMKLREPRHDH